jgi:hypothetical protein
MLALTLGVPLVTVPAQKADRFAGVPRALQPVVDRHEISGAVMLVATKDRVLHRSAVGTSDITSGRLSFDDPVQKFVPEFRESLRTTWLASTR